MIEGKVKTMYRDNEIIKDIEQGLYWYKQGGLTIEYCTRRAIANIEQGTSVIDDIDTRIKEQNRLYKYYFYRMHKAIIYLEKQ